MVSSLMMLYGCHQRLHIRCCWWMDLLLSLHIFLIEFALSVALHNFDDQLMFSCVVAIVQNSSLLTVSNIKISHRVFMSVTIFVDLYYDGLCVFDILILVCYDLFVCGL